MEEFWVGILTSNDTSRVRDHSKVCKTREDAEKWCADILHQRVDYSHAFILKATDVVQRMSAPIQTTSLLPKKTSLPTIPHEEVARNHDEYHLEQSEDPRLPLNADF